jgi:membrane fusion protein (multidrug efflux system)
MKGQPTALVVNQDNKVELRELKADRTIGDQWLINDGLHSGDRLITEGLQFIKPGDEVSVSEASNVKVANPSPDTANTSAQGE